MPHDFDDPDPLPAALSGIKRASLLTPSTERAEEQQKPFAVAVARAGVRHDVKLPQFAVSPDSPVRFLRFHAATRVSVVDVRDNAAVAAAALIGARHEGRTYTRTHSKAQTHAEMAARLSSAAVREIRFADASDDQLREAMAGVKIPEWQVESLFEDCTHYARCELAAYGMDAAIGYRPRGFDGSAATMCPRSGLKGRAAETAAHPRGHARLAPAGLAAHPDHG